MKTSDGSLAAAITIARFVLPVSVTIASADTCAGSSSSRPIFVRTGADRTTSSAPATRARSSCTSIAAMSIAGHARLAACTIELPINPMPTTAIRVNGGLDTPASAGDRLEADAASDGRRDDAQLRHQTIELRWEERLGAVAQGVIRIGVDFDQEPVA